MTNYISFFSESEVNRVIDFIGNEAFKSLFKKNPRQFNAIQPGFTPNKLTPERTLSIVKKNLNSQFIKDIINSCIATWLKEVNESIAQLERSGMSHNDAMAETLIDSYFSEFLHAYFKCMNIEVSEEEINALHAKIDALDKQREEESKSNRKIADLEGIVDKQKEEINELQQKIHEIAQNKDKQIAESEELLKKAQERISELESFKESSNSVITSPEILSQYDDSNILSRLSFTDDNHYSLCFVSLSNSDEVWLIRCADINCKGRIELFYKDDTQPIIFENRDKLFYKDGPSENGATDIWEWSAIPNRADPTKDYVVTKYNHNIVPIEVAVFNDFASLDELVEAMKTGVVFSPKSDRVLLSIYSGGKYIGITI